MKKNKLTVNQKINKAIKTKKFDSFMDLFDIPVEKKRVMPNNNTINKKSMLNTLHKVKTYTGVSSKYDIDIIYNILPRLNHIIDTLCLKFNINKFDNEKITPETDIKNINSGTDIEKTDVEKTDIEKIDIEKTDVENDEEIKKFLGDCGDVGRRGISGKNGKLTSRKETDLINNLNKINIVLDKILLKIK
jgi:hypothetical protein